MRVKGGGSGVGVPALDGLKDNEVLLRPGDHLRVNRGAYYHHGIAVPSSTFLNRGLRRMAEQAERRSSLDPGQVPGRGV